MNAFAKHYEKNFELYEQLMDAGVLSEKDMTDAINADGDISYKDQDAALMRIRDAVKENLDLEDSTSKEFYEGIPQVDKFTPNKKDWRDYDQEQMGRLAESMHFNWKNKDDRSVMMNQLMNETIRDDKKKAYEDYKKEHPFAGFINEHILAPNVSQRLKKGEDITNTDIALDAANVGTYLIPGAGAAATKAGKAAWLAADAAAQGASQLATDINQGNELGIHNVTMPLVGAGMGAMTEMVPRLAKGAVDAVTQGFGGRMSKPVGDVGEDWITKVFGNATKEAKDQVMKETEETLSKTTLRKNASQSTKEALDKSFEETATAAEKDLARKKQYFMEHPEKWKTADLAPGVRAELKKDKNFSKVMKEVLDESQSKLKKQGKAAAQGASRSAGRGVAITQTNQTRSKNVNTKERQDADDEQWYIDNYSRFWDAGFAPHGPDSDPTVKAYKKYISTKEVFGK